VEIASSASKSLARRHDENEDNERNRKNFWGSSNINNTDSSDSSSGLHPAIVCIAAAYRTLDLESAHKKSS
jgi:hypothetical protein